jgi:hypothetical protein
MTENLRKHTLFILPSVAETEKFILHPEPSPVVTFKIYLQNFKKAFNRSAARFEVII